MIELQEQPDGLLRRSFGGDTLNTAIYLARLGVDVEYVTALGDDAWSGEMVAAWEREGVGTAHVLRLPGRLPGLYVIHTDAAGERRFEYWRGNAAAREVLRHLAADVLDGFDVLYLSGITLSIYDDDSRGRLFAMLESARQRGAQVVFDTNFRPRGWPDFAVARSLYRRMFAVAGIVLASSEDLGLLYGTGGEAVLRSYADGREVVLKRDLPGSVVLAAGAEHVIEAVPVPAVVDTTAAGDSFAAAYLAGRLAGVLPADAARAGHALAGEVVGHRGAIMPRRPTGVGA
jgi:2-dehydro-3-deoxygluconokinase